MDANGSAWYIMMESSTRTPLASSATSKPHELEASELTSSSYWRLPLRSLDANGLLPALVLVDFDRAAVALQRDAHFGCGIWYHHIKLFLSYKRRFA